MGTQVVVKGRFVGGGLYNPKETQNGDMKYSACVVLEDGESKKIEKIIKAAIDEKWNGKQPKNSVIWGVRKGDDEEFEHSFEKEFINPKAGEDKKVSVLRRVEGKLEECEDVYPGSYIHVSVNAYAYDGDAKKKMKPGVALGLRSVLFWKDGERIGGGFDQSEFEGCDSEVDADSFGEEAEALL